MKVGNIQHSTAPFFTVVENMISAGTALLHWSVEQLLSVRKIQTCIMMSKQTENCSSPLLSQVQIVPTLTPQCNGKADRISRAIRCLQR